MDLLLALTENEVHELVWSERTSATHASRKTHTRTSWTKHLATTRTNRRHIAAALAAGADVIVTNNLADFPSEPLALLGLRVMTADEYLCELFGSARTEVITTIRRLAREKRNPPMTPMDLLARIGKIAPEFFGLAKRHFKET
jgi:hypothetical protein